MRLGGYRAVPVPVDAEGMTVDGLRAALAAGVRAIICTPRAQNPTGASLTAQRAAQLRAVLTDHPYVLLIEDEPNIVEALSFLLTRDGWTVHAHGDGATALDRVRRDRPEVIVLDVMLPGRSGFDLLRDLQKKHNLAYLFISHDLKVVKALANHVIVMRLGKVVEEGPADQIFRAPREDYTRALMAAAFNLEAVEDGAINQ